MDFVVIVSCGDNYEVYDDKIIGLAYRGKGFNMCPQAKSENKHLSEVKKVKRFYTPHLTGEEAQKGLNEKTLFESILRINQKKYEEGFVDNPNGDGASDILIFGLHDRNRALHGDRVLFRIKDRCDWAITEEGYDLWQKEKNIYLESKAKSDFSFAVAQQKKRDGLNNTFNNELVIGNKKSIRGEAPTKVITYSREELLNFRLHNSTSDKKVANITDQHIYDFHELREKSQNSRVHFLRELPEADQCISSKYLQKTGEIVYIMEKKHTRVAVGSLKILSTGSKRWILFSPSDSRIPRIIIPREQAPDGFFSRPQDFSKFLYVAQITVWPASSQFAPGRLVCLLGLLGNIESETKGFLMANGVDTSDFPDSALLPLDIGRKDEWKIPDEELSYRRDFRNEVIFTIDPASARDLDDALHVKAIADCDGAGTSGWEVGVHIADVGYFVKFGTELDSIAAKRGTSVYLVDRVIPMLPRLLCEELCSLKSGIDRLTMSVVWKVDDEGNIYDEWFGRSIIRTCCQLSYEHAQEIIENPGKSIEQVRYPDVFNSKTLEEIRTSILRLNKLAQNLYQKRVQNGSLRIERLKLCFSLKENSIPCGVSIYERNEANSLVEEFMLLANIAVARRIVRAFPEKALLRRHPPPQENKLQIMIDKCSAIGFHVDGSSSASIARSLANFADHSESGIPIVQVISHFLLKSMQLATYFCTGTRANEIEYAHYALSVPLYTHFTSPIRRYPDIMVAGDKDLVELNNETWQIEVLVTRSLHSGSTKREMRTDKVHRFLAAALGYETEPKLSVKEINAIASHCNDRKLAAKAVSDASAELFFYVFVKECGPLVERAVVLHVLDASFDVFIVKYGLVKRVYINKVEFPKPYEYNKDDKVMPYLCLYWPCEMSSEIFEQRIELFSILDVMLSSSDESVKLKASVVKPSEPKNIKLQDFLE